MSNLTGTEKKGRRVRRPTGGLTNINRDRWKYLSAPDELPIAQNLIHGKKNRVKKQQDDATAASKAKAAVVATDIDGDGIIDVREMRMAKFLHEITSNMKDASEKELQEARVKIGKYTISQEFIERNNGKLWRYGTIFADKTNEEAVRYIAEHRKFIKIMPYLETIERQRTIRSSHHLRSCITEAKLESLEPTQTWVYTHRKVRTPTRMQARAALNAGSSKYAAFEQKEEIEMDLEALDELPNQINSVITNDYGAIDIDGDGVIDDYEMKLHIQLKDSRLHGLQPSDLNGDGIIDAKEQHVHDISVSTKLQAEGRLLMASEFVSRNNGIMWQYHDSYKGKTDDEVVHMIANDKGVFSKTMNKLRAKERLFGLKSSKGVTSCLVDPKEIKFRADPANVLTPRQIKSKTELNTAQRDYSKQLNSHSTKSHSVFIKPLPLDSLQKHILADQKVKSHLHRSESCPEIGLPQLYASPLKLPTVKDFRITKWKNGTKEPPIY
ncbi:hypothetical protein THRCLA_04730 [Thraustotheca clavata]|uniref:Uncharacterized protein n=1 Tax=Thraustotheca clavata TaxID=74557 RepID=A0A1V9ZY64_9STRA|nr:hypothetical protein THRCLA_04730 [Thraustotheca clavata]